MRHKLSKQIITVYKWNEIIFWVIVMNHIYHLPRFFLISLAQDGQCCVEVGNALLERLAKRNPTFPELGHSVKLQKHVFLFSRK